MERCFVFYANYEYKNLEDFRTSEDESHVELQEKVRKMLMEDPNVKNPIHPKSEDELKEILAKGAQLYKVACEVCHGKDANGNGILYNDGDGKYAAKPANFVLGDLLNGPDGQFINAIMHGKGKMQPHVDKLSPEERWLVIHYIRSLQAKVKEVEYNPIVDSNEHDDHNELSNHEDHHDQSDNGADDHSGKESH